MKNPIYFLLLFLVILTFSCSSDDDNSSSNSEVYQKLIGKWYFADPEVYGYSTNNSFTFTSDGKVTYSFWTGGQNNDFNSEAGTFSVEGDILTMVYPETITLTFVQEVIFIDESTVTFVQVEGSNQEPYDGTYYKAD